MTAFANQLKSEIARIAKKEARVETLQLKKASAQYRSDIAALKRYVAALEVTVKKLSKSQPKPVLKIEEELTTALRFRAGGGGPGRRSRLRRHRVQWVSASGRPNARRPPREPTRKQRRR